LELRGVPAQLISWIKVTFTKLPLRGAELLILPTIVIYLMWEDWLTLGDCAYYTRSGQEILAGGNPYLGDAKWGSFSAVIMFLLFGWYSQVIASGLLLAANLLGIYKFSRMQDISRNSAIAISLIVAISSVNRENLVNGQITGLILLAIAQGRNLSSRIHFSFLQSGLIVFAVEMKPQVAIPLMLFLWKKQELHWIRIVVFASVAHVIINFYNGDFLEKDFISQILRTSTSNSGKTWENTNNLLPILDELIKNDSITKMLGLGIVLISCMYIFNKTDEKSIYALAFTALFMPYIHLYDLLGITVICLIKLHKARAFTGIHVVAIMILLSPLKNIEPENLVLTALVSIVLMSNNSMRIEKEVFPGILLVLLFIPNLLPGIRPNSNVILNSWITTSVLIALLILNSSSKSERNNA
jgi:hypothetical protein